MQGFLVWRSGLAVALVLAVHAAPGSAGVIVDPGPLDHLKCYTVHDSLAPVKYTADLNNQFGIEQGCLVGVPARLFCVESDKRIVPPPDPPGGGPGGDAAGHFLCYTLRCPGENQISTIAQDQFGTRRIRLEREVLLCAPTNKLICGDGEIDPGEACDTGSDATSICPDDSECLADCTCPASVCCQCPDTCIDLETGICPSTCVTLAGVRCTSTGRCERPCPCDAACVQSNGDEGICRLTGTSIVSPCECGPPGDDCPCGDRCRLDGEAGQCRPLNGPNEPCECFVPPDDCICGTTCISENNRPGLCVPGDAAGDACKCRPVGQPECPCGSRCTDANGTVGLCVVDPTTNVCRCQPPPVDDCPCGATCLDASGAGGHCRPLNGTPCECVRDEVPPECPCGAVCTTDAGIVGHCRQVAGVPANLCKCTEDPPDDCPCGTACASEGEPGVCRPLNGPNQPCECFVPPPDDCPCGANCVVGGATGLCRRLNGPNEPCECFIPPPDDCPCGAVCTHETGEAGRCRPLAAGAAECVCKLLGATDNTSVRSHGSRPDATLR